MKSKVFSLKRTLIVLPLLFQLVTLLVCFVVLMAFALRLDSGGSYTDESITPVIADSIIRNRDGSLSVRLTPALIKLQTETPTLWFAAENDAGQRVEFGNVPAQYTSLNGRLNELSYAQFRDRSPPYRLSAVVRREESSIGKLTILGHGRLTELSLTVLFASSAFVIPIFVLFTLISLIITPWIVKRSLAGVNRIAQDAEKIDATRRGLQLSEKQVPKEIAPLVRAVNNALKRLDEDYERQRRFIVSAAHELRTPIAILRIKVDAAEDAACRGLAHDVDRLANLAEQLLDLQRLDTGRFDETIELVGLARTVAGNLAPLLIASGRTIEVIIDNPCSIKGDSGAIERVITNLVQNSIEHGGDHVIIRVIGYGFEVEDDGPGIPLEERERVFEPFHRLSPRSTGTGLGLNLVQQVVERHDGKVMLLASPEGGTLARIVFPVASEVSV